MILCESAFAFHVGLDASSFAIMLLTSASVITMRLFDWNCSRIRFSTASSRMTFAMLDLIIFVALSRTILLMLSAHDVRRPPTCIWVSMTLVSIACLV